MATGGLVGEDRPDTAAAASDRGEMWTLDPDSPRVRAAVIPPVSAVALFVEDDPPPP
jgi:hypothetical protein